MKNKRAILLVVIFILSVSMFTGCQKTGTVILKTNGGICEISEYVNVFSIEEEPIPMKTGYDFAGWYNNPNLTGSRIAFPFRVQEDVTLYAKWLVNEEYVVKNLFIQRANGVEPYIGNGTYFTSRTVKQGNTITYATTNYGNNYMIVTMFTYNQYYNTFKITNFVATNLNIGLQSEIEFEWGTFEKGGSDINSFYYFNEDEEIVWSNKYSIKVNSYISGKLNLTLLEDINNHYSGSISIIDEKNLIISSLQDSLVYANQFLEDANIKIH